MALFESVEFIWSIFLEKKKVSLWLLGANADLMAYNESIKTWLRNGVKYKRQMHSIITLAVLSAQFQLLLNGRRTTTATTNLSWTEYCYYCLSNRATFGVLKGIGLQAPTIFYNCKILARR